MEYIGKRASIRRSENELSIVIVAHAEKWKNRLLFAWFVIWTICGIFVFTQFFVTPDQDLKAMLIVWLGFWAYFEYRTYRAVLYRRLGVEKIKLRDGKLQYKREIAGKGKIRTYELDFIKDLRVIVPKENSFADSMSSSYWSLAGERLAFDYYGKEIKFGIQLEPADAEALYKVIKKSIR